MPIRVFGKSVERAGGELSMTTATTSEPGSALQFARHGAQPGTSRRKRRSGSHPTGQVNEVLTQVSMLVGRGARLHRRDVRPSILGLLERLPQTAGFVMSAAFEVLAWNDLAAALMEDFAPLDPKHRNLARRAFLGPQGAGAALYGVSDAAEFRLSVVMQLRATLARYPADPAVSGLVDELRDASPDFARLWERHDVQAAPMLTKTFRHPAVGEITVNCDVLTLTDRDQCLVLYSAPPGSPSAEALALLNVLGTEATHYLP
ncbi:MmyB family transcriptional regulator [Streptomyces sp. NBC_01320]|uniref:MmyB family transcriptional regulator n=1 Tax=Streptomyces sp. NBC_01320 TaxID=2903824 RepID=UPI002E12E436|nr:hypothetical protein OG395_01035 [Streptomyces sp. NBC_01320]WSK01052.1 hypothetical protein OG395_54320 [Streptomyces sp. NBC_01320]